MELIRNWLTGSFLRIENGKKRIVTVNLNNKIYLKYSTWIDNVYEMIEKDILLLYVYFLFYFILFHSDLSGMRVEVYVKLMAGTPASRPKALEYVTTGPVRI